MADNKDQNAFRGVKHSQENGTEKPELTTITIKIDKDLAKKVKELGYNHATIYRLGLNLITKIDEYIDSIETLNKTINKITEELQKSNNIISSTLSSIHAMSKDINTNADRIYTLSTSIISAIADAISSVKAIGENISKEIDRMVIEFSRLEELSRNIRNITNELSDFRELNAQLRIKVTELTRILSIFTMKPINEIDSIRKDIVEKLEKIMSNPSISTIAKKDLDVIMDLLSEQGQKIAQIRRYFKEIEG